MLGNYVKKVRLEDLNREGTVIQLGGIAPTMLDRPSMHGHRPIRSAGSIQLADPRIVGWAEFDEFNSRLRKITIWPAAQDRFPGAFDRNGVTDAIHGDGGVEAVMKSLSTVDAYITKAMKSEAASIGSLDWHDLNRIRRDVQNVWHALRNGGPMSAKLAAAGFGIMSLNVVPVEVANYGRIPSPAKSAAAY